MRKKVSEEAEAEKKPIRPVPPPPPPSRLEEKSSARGTTPGVQMLKEVWHIDTGRKKKEMAPPGISTDIYSVPKQRQMPPRNTGGAR